MAQDQIRQTVLDVLSDPMNIPSTFWDYATQNWLKDAPVFPISQVFGFSQYTAQTAIVTTSETTTSTTYTDLATVGPTLSGLADGKYLILWGAVVFMSASGKTGLVGPNINGTTPTADARNQSTTAASVMSFQLASLSNNGSSTIKLQYASDTGPTTATFLNRGLMALRYGNL